MLKSLTCVSVNYSAQVLGREVYTSNNQLGGVQIMHNNGVSHVTVPDDFEGVYTILQWLSYIPKVRGCCRMVAWGITPYLVGDLPFVALPCRITGAQCLSWP